MEIHNIFFLNLNNDLLRNGSLTVFLDSPDSIPKLIETRRRYKNIKNY